MIYHNNNYQEFTIISHFLVKYCKNKKLPLSFSGEINGCENGRN